jgi:PAS domain S-box-containing protein
VLYAPDMRASLVHSEGSLFAIMPELAGTQGADVVKPGSFFTRHRDSGQQETLLTGISSVTGDERMMALRAVKPANLAMDKTLVVSVGRDLPAIFVVWRRDAYEKAALFGLISLITTGGLFLIQRRQRAYARVVAHDELERQKAEASQRKSESLFRNYFTLGQVGMAITSVDKGWLDVNGRLCEMLGYPKEELLKKTWLELTHPDDVEPDMVQFNRLLSGEIERYAMDKMFMHKNGSIVHTHLTAACQRNPDKSVEYVIASLQDITERKQAEARSHEGENRRISEQAAALEAQRQAGLATLNLMEDAIAARTRAEAMTATLDKQLDELRRWQQVTLGREGRVLAMKKEVNSLLAELGQPPRYPSAAEAEPGK